MNNKEQAFKMIEERIETMQKLSIECIEFIYKAAYNEAIEDVARIFGDSEGELNKLKKE